MPVALVLRFVQETVGRFDGLIEWATAVLAFLATHRLWDKLVPVNCPSCRGTMAKAYGPGKQVSFACRTCGQRQ